MSKKENNIDLSRLPRCACFNLRKSARAVTQLYDRILKPAGLRGTQFTILGMLAKLDGATINKLADFLIMDRTTVTRNLRPLERDGLLLIASGEDKRTREIRLTEKGLQTLKKALPLWEEAQKHFTEGLGENKLRDFLNDLSVAISLAQSK